MPYAVLPLAVDTRLVRNDHTAHQRLRIKVLTHILRPFVHTQERAHAVPGTMPEVTLEAPQRLPGKSIDTAAGSAFGEQRHGKVDVPFEHQCIIFPLERGKVTEGNGTGNVGGAVKVLAAGVAQIQPVRFQQRSIAARSHIMRKSGAGAVCRYGLKTVALIA